MLPIHGNTLGLMMFVVAALIAGVGGLALKLPDPLTMSAVGAGLVAMDTVIRLRSRSEPRWLMRQELGGYLFFAPVWAFGLFVIVANVLSGVSKS